MEFSFSADGVDEEAPLIYLWLLDYPDGTQERYVGKAKGGSKRPKHHYRRNITRMRSGLPYRKGKPNGWRRVHLEIDACLNAGGRLTLKLVANCDIQEINAKEAHYITALAATLNGRLGQSLLN